MATKRKVAPADASQASAWINWRTQTRRPFRRGFVPYGGVASVTAAAKKKRRKALGVEVQEDPLGEEITPAPLDSFEELGVLPPWVLQALRDAERYEPMPLEAQALPIAIAGQNLFAISSKATAGAAAAGYTGSYLLPAIVHVLDQPALTEEEQGPVVIVLVPTQEGSDRVARLARQILGHSADGADTRGHVGGLRAVDVSGGGVRSEKLRELGPTGAHVVVGTPKRIHDMAMKGQLSLQRVTFLVVDGADRALEKGLEQEVRDIATWVRPERQTMVLAAAASKELTELAGELCYSGGAPVRIKVAGKAAEAAEEW
mmetsp:Transcript_112647/g.318205  ORF Transcript_112647/g.318205 Transcript_112647/m.318205 type:complete len:316 (-) Transcript_112647:163-1110(-)